MHLRSPSGCESMVSGQSWLSVAIRGSFVVQKLPFPGSNSAPVPERDRSSVAARELRSGRRNPRNLLASEPAAGEGPLALCGSARIQSKTNLGPEFVWTNSSGCAECRATKLQKIMALTYCKQCEGEGSVVAPMGPAGGTALSPASPTPPVRPVSNAPKEAGPPLPQSSHGAVGRWAVGQFTGGLHAADFNPGGCCGSRCRRHPGQS